MRRTAARTVLAGAAALTLLTACGGGSGGSSAAGSTSSSGSSSSASSSGGSDSGSTFCRQASRLITSIQSAPSTSTDPTKLAPLFQQAAAGIRAISAPAAIASGWSALADGLDQLGAAYAKTDVSDPSSAASFQQTATQLESKLSGSVTSVDTYLQSHCGIDVSGTDTASPTS